MPATRGSILAVPRAIRYLPLPTLALSMSVRALAGYGNLIILKHSNSFITAYGHNQTILVKEYQTVRKGQKIAEKGSSGADQIKLHFEIRRQGLAVDPLKYLPPR